MSTGQTEMNPNWAQPQRQRGGCCSGMSCVMIGCGGMLLLCCGVGTWAVFYFRSWVSEDPAEIAAARQQIARIDVPEDLAPLVRVKMQLPFMGEIGTGVVFADEDSRSNLLLLTINRRFAEGDESNFDEALQQSLRQHGMQQDEDFQVTRSDKRTFNVRGEEVTFDFARGKSGETGKELLQVRGVFKGNSGPVIFQFLGDPQKYDEEAVAEIIESIE